MTSDSEWSYETAPDLGKSFTDRLRDFPREPDMLVYSLRSLAALALRSWLKIYHRVCIVGRERIPQESCILVANHQSHLDALTLVSALPLQRLHRVFPAAAKDYFFSSMSRTVFSAIFVNALPFAREVSGRQSIRLCRALLSKPGNVLVLFPEGTRSKTGEIGRFLPGIGMIATGTDVPIVPCHLAGCHDALPKGSALPKPCKLHLTIGEPMRFAAKTPAREVAARLESAVRELGADPQRK